MVFTEKYSSRNVSVALAFVILLFVSIVSNIVVGYEFNSVRKIDVAALAITENGEGKIIHFSLWVIPGNGELFVVGNKDLLSEDVISSLNFSSWMASRISGVFHDNYDYYVEYRGSSSVSGLSATLLFTLGYTILLRNDPWDGNATATGLIAPTGIVGNVSGVEEKYRVAVEDNYQRILAPVYPKLINKPNYRSVVSIIDSYDYFTLKPLFPKYDRVYEIVLSNRSSIMDKILYESWEYFYNKSSTLLNYLDQMVGNVLNKRVKEYYDAGVYALNESVYYANNRLYYTAASRAFYSYWMLYTVLVYISYVFEHADLREYVRNLSNDIRVLNSTLSELRRNLSSKLTLYDIDVLINVYERFFDSIKYYNFSVDILNKGLVSEEQLIDYASNISYAIARLETAKQWLKFLDLRDEIGKTVVSMDILHKSVVNEYGLLYSFALFLESLGFTNVTKFVDDLLSDRWIYSDDLVLLSRIIWIERDLSNFLLSIPQYTLLTELVREGIRISVIRSLKYFHLYYGELLPSAYTALEFYTTSEGLGVTPLSTSLLHLLVLYEISSLKEPLFTGAIQDRIMLFYMDKLVLLSIILITLGSFVIGYSIGIYGRRSVE